MSNEDDAVQVPTGYEQYNIIQKLRFKLNDNRELLYTGLFTTSSDIPRYDRLLQVRDSLPRFGEWFYGPQMWTLHAITFTESNHTAFFDQLSLTGSMQFYRESRNDRPFRDTLIRNRTEKVWVGALNLDLQKRLSRRNAPEVDLYYGLEGYINDVSSSAFRQNINTSEVLSSTTRYPDGGSFVTSVAGYAQLRAGLTEDLTVAGGLRYTWYDLSSTINDQNAFPFAGSDLGLTTGAFSGSVGLTWEASSKLVLHTNVSSGFRAPNVDDIAKIFDSAPGVLVIPNANLAPRVQLHVGRGLHLGTNGRGGVHGQRLSDLGN